MIVLRIVSVRTGMEVSRAVVDDNGAVTYTGGTSAPAAVRAWMRRHDVGEAEAIAALAAEGWSNGYLMAAQA